MKFFDPLKGKKALTKIFLTAIIILAAFLRLNHLHSLPPGLSQDETAIGYNAYLINELGKDEYGKSFPLYFKSFGDYKLPTYIYLTALSEKLFGLNEFAVRLPSAVAGIIAVAGLYFLVFTITKNTTLSILSSLSLTFNPWHLFFSRAAFEVNIALTLSIIGTTMFIKAIKRKKILYLAGSVILFALCLYTYNVTRLIAPLLLILLLFLYKNELKKFGKIKLLTTLCVFPFLLIPFFITFFSPEGATSAHSSLITSADIVAKNVEFRSYLLKLPSIYTKIMFNKYVYMIWQYVQNIVQLFSGAFFFINGTPHINQGIGNVGSFHIFDIVFFIAGLYAYIRYKIGKYRLFALWFFIALLVLALSKEVPHATRGYFLVIPMTFFITIGFMYVVRLISQINMKKQFIAYGIIGFIMFYSIQFYFFSYYLRFPYIYDHPWRRPDKELTLYLKKVDHRYKEIIIDRNADYAYTSLLFHYPYPPNQFLSSVKRYPEVAGTLTLPKSFGKYHYRDIDWDHEIVKRNALIISNLNSHTSKLGVPYKEVRTANKHLVLSVDEKIMQSPLSEVVFVIIDLNKVIGKE